MKAQSLFSAVLLVAFAQCAAGADTFPIDTTTLRKLTRPGANRLDLGNKISFRVPEKLLYVTEDKLPDFAERMRLTLAGDEAGVVMPEDFPWYTIIFLPKEDPLAGQKDLANLDKELLMAWQEKFTADHTPRKAGVGKTWKLGNWTHPTTYDAEKKILILGVRMTADSGDANKDMMNYKVFIYGPEKQIVCLQTIAPISAWEKPIARTQKLIEEVKFPELAPETNSTEELMYYGKLIGGGLLGTVVVIIFARLLMGGRGATAAGPLRRQGLPR